MSRVGMLSQRFQKPWADGEGADGANVLLLFKKDKTKRARSLLGSKVVAGRKGQSHVRMTAEVVRSAMSWNPYVLPTPPYLPLE